MASVNVCQTDGYWVWGAENARPENDGQRKMWDWNLAEWKVTNKLLTESWRLENSGLENDGQTLNGILESATRLKGWRPIHTERVYVRRRAYTRSKSNRPCPTWRLMHSHFHGNHIWPMEPVWIPMSCSLLVTSVSDEGITTDHVPRKFLMRRKMFSILYTLYRWTVVILAVTASLRPL